MLSRAPAWVELARREVLAHLLAGSLDEPGVVENGLDLLGRGVAADVLLLQDVSQVRPFTYAVDDVLDYLSLPLITSPGVEDPVPKRASLLSHAPSFGPWLPQV